jgi:hypothetical protein
MGLERCSNCGKNREPTWAEWYARPQRRLSPEEIGRETRRLVCMCASGSLLQVAADEASDCPELLESLGDASRSRRLGLMFAAQFLDYLILPYD